MLDALYEKSINKRVKIQEHFENLQKNIDIEKVNNKYNLHEFKKEKQTKSFLATDGSFNSTRFMSDFVYAVASQSILSFPETSLIKDTSSADIDYTTTVQAQNLNRKLSRQMNILELKSMIKSMQNHDDKIDYILIDGNISGTLRNFQLPILEEKYKHLHYPIRQHIKIIENKLKNNTFDINVTSIEEENDIYLTIKDDLPPDTEYKEIKDQILDYYDALEQLACIKYLMDKYHGKIIGVSKTSNTNNIFKENMPDAAVLEYSTISAGYTEIRAPLVNKKLVRRVSNNNYLTVEYPLYAEDIMNYQYLIFFVRLEKRKNVLKIEIPIKEEDLYMNNEGIIEEILEDLYSISIDGYPYILKKAHHEVVIKNKNIDRIINKYELFLKNGRDML